MVWEYHLALWLKWEPCMRFLIILVNFDPFRQLSMELRKLQVATVSSKRVFELLDDESEHDRYSREKVQVSEHDIEFKGLIRKL